MRTKFDIKIKWYKTVSDEIEKQNKSRKGLKKIAINRIRTKFVIKIQWNKIKDMKLKNKINQENNIRNNNKKNKDQIW